jgi:hypothetical protein
MNTRRIVLTALATGILTTSAPAAFHLMQIEEIIGGINGDPTAQAIQLRQRSANNHVVSGTQLWARDATGGSAILLLTIPGNVSLANPIPQDYLSGGKVTFESSGFIYWSVAFGNYTGSNTGQFDNDSNGNFGTPFPNALPFDTLRGIHFPGAFSAGSTTNFNDYAFTPNPAQVRNNAGGNFTVVPEPASVSFMALGALALGGVIFARRRR